MSRGEWSQGRPVFRKVDGESRVFLVKDGKTTWSIRKSVAAGEAHITSGRATNFPTSPEAGPSSRDGVQKWRYAVGGV